VNHPIIIRTFRPIIRFRPAGVESSVTNPRGATTSYTYSAADRLEATTDALGHEWAFTHDAAGNTTSSAYPTGETVSRTYTADDLLATSACSTGEHYAFAYTPAHRLSGGALGFDYNPVGWPLSATDTAESIRHLVG
jgi:YD repeat-containing protein